jgi:hypothetical protein
MPNWADLRSQALGLPKGSAFGTKLQVVAVGGKQRLLTSTSAHLCEAARTFKGGLKPIANYSLFTTADGRLAAITRDAIDKGLPQAAGIPIIDGEKVDPAHEPDPSRAA